MFGKAVKLLLAFFLIASFAHAQTIPGASNFGQICPGGGAFCSQPAACSYTPPLDANPAVAAYSFRMLATNWAGKNLVRLRRSSDGATKDFQGVYTSCALNQNDSFFDSSTYTLVIWYDQSGAGQNYVQNTVNQQPVVTLNCVNGLPCVTWPNTATGYFSSMLNVNTMTFSAVATTGASGLSGTLIAATGGNQNNMRMLACNYTGTCAAGVQWNSGGSAVSATIAASATTPYVLTGTYDNNNVDIYLNGVAGTQNTTTTAAGTTSYLQLGGTGGDFFGTGGGGFAPSLWPGSISEAITFAPELSSTNSGIVAANQMSYWGL